MKKKEKIRILVEKMVNILIGSDDYTCEDFACAISCFVGAVDDLIKKDNSIPNGLFAKYVYDMIGAVCNVSSDQPKCNLSTEHSQTDKEN